MCQAFIQHAMEERNSISIIMKDGIFHDDKCSVQEDRGEQV